MKADKASDQFFALDPSSPTFSDDYEGIISNTLEPCA